MDFVKMRAWWHHRQGLDGSMAKLSSAAILERTGWQRSVGGANPYLALHARNSAKRQSMDEDVQSLRIHELPSARGCTYVLPNSQFALGLVCGQGFSTKPTNLNAFKFLGYSQQELDDLCAGILSALDGNMLDPRELKEPLGNLIKNFGEEGKKRGQSTSLSLGLGVLQEQGLIRRVPVNGRIDQQRYAYTLWQPSPLENSQLSSENCFEELARQFFTWIAPATVSQFQWFSGLGVRASKEAISKINLVAIEPGSDYLIPADLVAEYKKFKTPSKPSIVLLGGMDNLFMLRRNVTDHVDPSDLKRQMRGEKAFTEVGGVSELTSHAIVDRGRLIGLWEFDCSISAIAYHSFIGKTPEVKAAVQKTEAFVRDQLGDARSFSLDSVQSRVPKIEALRAGLAEIA